MATQLIKSTIAENAVVVFSKSYCPYCVKAKQALQVGEQGAARRDRR